VGAHGSAGGEFLDPGIVVAIMTGVIAGAITVTSVVRHVAGLRLRQVKQSLLEDLRRELRDPEQDTTLPRRLQELEQRVSSQQDRIEELTEENRFLRRLVQDKDAHGT
jgi:predicted nuclease with TOPRIM domain